MDDRTTAAVIEDGISAGASDRFILHDREVDTPTLSPECQPLSRECQEPSHPLAAGPNPVSTNTQRRYGNPLCINGSRRSDILVTL